MCYIINNARYVDDNTTYYEHNKSHFEKYLIKTFSYVTTKQIPILKNLGAWWSPENFVS